MAFAAAAPDIDERVAEAVQFVRLADEVVGDFPELLLRMEVKALTRRGQATAGYRS